jgi:hypothetical protein
MRLEGNYEELFHCILTRFPRYGRITAVCETLLDTCNAGTVVCDFIVIFREWKR